MKYIINLTFFAGSNDAEDTDRGIYILESSKELEKEQISAIFREANKRCNNGLYEERDDDFNFPSYEEGINIDTLVRGVNEIIKDYATIRPLKEEVTVIDIEQ